MVTHKVYDTVLILKPDIFWSDFPSKIDSLVSFHCTHLLFSAWEKDEMANFKSPAQALSISTENEAAST